MRGFGRRIASAVTTAIMIIAPLPEVQPVQSQKSVPSRQDTVVRQKLIMAWWRSADGALTTTSSVNTSSSTALIFAFVITPRLSSR